MEISKARSNAALVGCAIILASGVGSTSILIASIPDIVVALKTDLTTLMMGPMLSTIAAFIASLIGTKVIDMLTPKWSLLLGTFCVSAVLALIGLFPTIEVWIWANILNGIVLAFGSYAATAGVVAGFKGAKTQSVFGIVSGIAALLVAAEVMIVAQMLHSMAYNQVLIIFAIGILIVGIFSNLVLIGKVPGTKERKAAIKAAKAAKASGGAATAQAASAQKALAPGVSLKDALKSPALYLFVATMFFGAWAQNGITGYMTVFFTVNGMTTSDAASFLSILTAAIAAYKFGSGWFIKKFGSKALAVVIFVCFGIGIGILLLWSSQPQNVVLAYVGILLTALIGFVTLIPGLFVPEIFGMRDYTSLNSAGMAGSYIGGATLMGGLAVIIAAMGISNAFVVLIVMGLIAMVCLLAALAVSPFKKQAETPAAAETAMTSEQ